MAFYYYNYITEEERQIIEQIFKNCQERKQREDIANAIAYMQQELDSTFYDMSEYTHTIQEEETQEEETIEEKVQIKIYDEAGNLTQNNLSAQLFEYFEYDYDYNSDHIRI